MRDNVDGANECPSSSLVIASVRVDCGDPGAIVGALSEKELLRRGAKEIVELRGVPNIELKGRPVQFNFRYCNWGIQFGCNKMEEIRRKKLKGYKEGIE